MLPAASLARTVAWTVPPAKAAPGTPTVQPPPTATVVFTTVAPTVTVTVSPGRYSPVTCPVTVTVACDSARLTMSSPAMIPMAMAVVAPLGGVRSMTGTVVGVETLPAASTSTRRPVKPGGTPPAKAEAGIVQVPFPATWAVMGWPEAPMIAAPPAVCSWTMAPASPVPVKPVAPAEIRTGAGGGDRSAPKGCSRVAVRVLPASSVLVTATVSPCDAAKAAPLKATVQLPSAARVVEAWAPFARVTRTASPASNSPVTSPDTAMVG